MSQPNSGEYSVRSLADILREHGLETELGTRPGRRRRTSDDPEVTGRSPRVEAPVRAQPPGPSSAPTPGQVAAAARAAAQARSRGAAPAAGRSPAATPPAAASSPAAARVPVTRWPDQDSSPGRPAAGLT